jgi:hypothetical protein
VITEPKARQFAEHWIRSWSSHDLDAIMSHYAPDVVLVSPAAARLLNDPSGTVTGKEALREYFNRGLQSYPDLNFDLVDVMWGLNSVVLYYVNQRGSRTAEFMEFDANGKVIRVVANYSA